MRSLGPGVRGARYWIAWVRFGPALRRDLWENLAFAVERGERIVPAFERLLEMERDLPRGLLDRPLNVILPHWLARMRGGDPLAEIISPWVSEHEDASFTAAGEAGVSGPQLQRLASDLRRLGALSALLRRAAAPLLLATALIWGSFAASHWYMFPAFEEVLADGPGGSGDVEWFGLAGLMYDLSALMAVWGGLVILAILIAGPILGPLAARHWTGPSRIALEGIVPGLQLYKIMSGVTWLLGMAALLDTGRQPQAAALTLREASTAYLRERIDAATSRPDLTLGDALLASRMHWPSVRILHRVRLCIGSDRVGDEFRAVADDEMIRLERGVAVLAEIVAISGQVFLTLFLVLLMFAQNDMAESLSKAAEF